MNSQKKRWGKILKFAQFEHDRERPTADRTLRLAASVADILIFALLMSLIGKFMGVIEAAYFRIDPGTLINGQFVRFCGYFMLGVFFFGASTWGFGGTLGKRLLGIKVVTRSGGRPHLWRCLVRDPILKYGLGFASAGIVPLLYLLKIWSQPLHDDWLGTTVKRVRGKA